MDFGENYIAINANGYTTSIMSAGMASGIVTNNNTYPPQLDIAGLRTQIQANLAALFPTSSTRDEVLILAATTPSGRAHEAYAYHLHWPTESERQERAMTASRASRASQQSSVAESVQTSRADTPSSEIPAIPQAVASFEAPRPAESPASPGSVVSAHGTTSSVGSASWNMETPSRSATPQEASISQGNAAPRIQQASLPRMRTQGNRVADWTLLARSGRGKTHSSAVDALADLLGVTEGMVRQLLDRVAVQGR